jgi:hypothetical protein
LKGAVPRGQAEGARPLLYARPARGGHGRELVPPLLNPRPPSYHRAVLPGGTSQASNVDTTTRNPMLLFLLFGLFLLRYAQRAVWTSPHIYDAVAP